MMKPKLARDAGRRAMVVNEVVQSVVVPTGDFGPGVWPALLPERAPRRSLVLGVGGGTVIHLMTQRFGALPIFGIEIDPRVLALAMEHFALDLPHLDLIVADVTEYVPALAAARRAIDDVVMAEQSGFDYILVDVYEGGEIVRGTLARPFLRDLRALATPDGTIVYNFFHDGRLNARLHRLRQVLHVERTIEIDLNVVVHCAASSPRPSTATNPPTGSRLSL